MKPLLYLGCPHADRADLQQALASVDLAVVWADSAAAAANELRRHEIPVILDLSRGSSALQLARDLRSDHPDALIFAVVDSRRPDLTTEAILTGVADVFARPPGPRRIALAIERECRASLRQTPDVFDAVVETLYHHSPTMRDVMPLIARAGSMRAGVTIRGEDGTGRQIVARAIHAVQGDTAAFVTVDCAALQAEELETALFGAASERSIEDERRAGGFEMIGRNSRLYEAIGGTLYLKNVGEAGTRVQARLSRVLRDREAILAESGTHMSVDVRPIAGVDHSIDAAIEEGRVREDLFRRLSVIRVDIPPLRQRREDIPALANWFVRDICAGLGIAPKMLSRPALALLSAMPWRGNAIELRALLEQVVAGRAEGSHIALEDLLAHVRLDGGAALFSNSGTLRQARARFEREYIAAVLEQHHGRISEAAKVLGIQRTNLYRKMRSLRVTRMRRTIKSRK